MLAAKTRLKKTTFTPKPTFKFDFIFKKKSTYCVKYRIEVFYAVLQNSTRKKIYSKKA